VLGVAAFVSDFELSLLDEVSVLDEPSDAEPLSAFAAGLEDE
jgi:hypothetical protein